jgi:Cu2+-exporting ATPase
MKVAAKMESQGKTVVFFMDDTAVLAVIAIADKIKETSKEAISSMKQKGIEVYMLTGDNEKTAKGVADKLAYLSIKRR